MTADHLAETIRVIERQGFTVHADDLRNGGICRVLILDSRGMSVALSIHPSRYDFTEAFQQFTAWQVNGGKYFRTKAARAA